MIGDQSILEGESTTIKCTVINNVVGGFLRWVKVYTTADGTIATVAIGTNNAVESDFKALKTESGEQRYTVSMDLVPNTQMNYIAQLKLKGVCLEFIF